MEVIEQTDSRLVIKSPILRSLVWSGTAVALIAIVLLTNVVIVDGNNFLWHQLVPLGCIIYTLYCFLSLHTSILTIDKSVGSLVCRNNYLFGLLPKSKSMPLTDVKQVNIEHIRVYKFNPAQIRLMFIGTNQKIWFASDHLHFDKGQNWIDAHNSQEEALVQRVTQFIGLPTSENQPNPLVKITDKMLNSQNINSRLMAVVVLLATGALVGFVLVLIYFNAVR